MKATLEYVERKFAEFNKLIFNDKLPQIPISLSDVSGFVGICRFKTRYGENNKIEYYDFSLGINTRIDLPEAEIEDTIIHEMIHYFIGYNQIEDASAHGPVFQTWMNLINEKYGRHLNISHKTTKEEREQLIDKRRRWHIVAVVSLSDGRVGIKVLPRVKQRILEFNQLILKQYAGAKIEYCMTDEPYFNQFPTSVSVNLAVVPSNELTLNISKAAQIEIVGSDIREKH